MRVRGAEHIPGEPDEDKALSKMIDAPLGDRSKWAPQWPALEDASIPLGQAKVLREGRDLTVVSYGRTMHLCSAAAEVVAAEGIDVEVIDLRTLWPYDWAAIKASVEKTGRVLFVNEDTEVTNFGEHLVRRTVDELFFKLLAPPKLVAGKFVPGIGLSDPLEAASVPQQPDLELAMRQLAATQP
jgi:2-oxoisovalerate dehydrogenase E1 component beta subunit